MYNNLDKENMFNAIWEFPDNLSEANKLGQSIKLQQDYRSISSIVVAGMGGSAIGGDVVSVLEKGCIDIPFFVCRGYYVPNWVNNNK